MSSLSSDAKLEYSLELANAVPWPVIDTPEERQRRVFTAIGAFDDLCPGNADQGRLAVQIVLCGAHSAETLREAGHLPERLCESEVLPRPGATLAREGRAAKRMLAQEQKYGWRPKPWRKARRRGQLQWRNHRRRQHRCWSHRRTQLWCHYAAAIGRHADRAAACPSHTMAAHPGRGPGPTANCRAAGCRAAASGGHPGPAAARAGRTRAAALPRGDRQGRGLCAEAPHDRGADAL